jgi:hypothetical protein
MRYRPKLPVLLFVMLGVSSLACSSLTVSMDQPVVVTRVVLVTRVISVPADLSGNRYAFIDESMTWTQAQAYCERQSAHLVTITSPEEQEIVTALLLSSGAKKVYWMGGTRENGQWKWITGESFSYTHWASGEPSHVSDEDYLNMIGLNNNYYSTPSHGFWDDIQEAGGKGEFTLSNFGLVCEWER